MTNKPIEILGYHGTSKERATAILTEGFRASDNDYDWLGTGIYFFQDAPLRARQWATQQHPQAPAVICSRIHLDNCIDLFDIGWQPLLKNVLIHLWSNTKVQSNRYQNKTQNDRKHIV
jgi:hypothetical protein